MEIQEKIRQYLGEDATDQEKHDKLNDIFQALERLTNEVDELDVLDRDENSSGVGDLTDQLTTFRKMLGGLYQVLDRATKVVPMEQNEDDAALQKKLDDLYGAKQGEPKFVYFNAEDGKVKMQVDNRVVVHSADPKDIAQAMADHGVSNQDRMAHSSDVDFADEEGFANSGDAHEIIDQALQLAGLGESVVEREETDEGNEFSGELAKAKAAGKKEFEVDGKKYKVESETPVSNDLADIKRLAGL